MSEKICPRCGIVLAGTAVKCGNCGMVIGGEEVPQPVVVEEKEPLIRENVEEVEKEPLISQPAADSFSPGGEGLSAGTDEPRGEGAKADSDHSEGKKEIVRLAVVLAIIAVAVLGACVGVCGIVLGWFGKDTPHPAATQPPVSPAGPVVAEQVPPAPDNPRGEGLEAGTDKPEGEEAEWLKGAAYETDGGLYCFDKDGKTYYFISEERADFVKGRISIRKADEDEIREAGAAEILKAHDEGKLAVVDVLVDKELYFDRQKSGMKYTLYIAGSGNKAEIFDTGWGYAFSGDKTDAPSHVKLESYFTGTVEPGSVEADERDAGETDFANVDFSAGQSRRSGSQFCVTGSEVIKADDLVPPEGMVITVLSSDGKYIFYGAGHVGENGPRTEVFYRYDRDLNETKLMVKDKVQDFLFHDGLIYYTDYDKLVCMDYEGNCTNIWNYGVYCFEAAGEDIYLYDGEEWELLDAADGTDKGFISSGINYAYTCDRAAFYNGYLFFSAFDHERKSVSIRALCVEDGSELILGEELDGSAEDSYSSAFTGSRIYYSSNDREVLNCMDIATGTVESVKLSDAGYWYLNDIQTAGTTVYISVTDPNGTKHIITGEELF